MAYDEHGDNSGSSVAAPLRWVVVPAVLAIALLILNAATDLDRVLARLVFDASSAGVPLRTNFWLDVVMHHWAKYAVASLGCIVAGSFFLSFILPTLRPQRRLLMFLALALALAPLSVTLGKAASVRHCPWDVDEFGGFVPYTRLFEPPTPGVDPGHCFPAGHAATGFALLAFYFAAYARRMRSTARVLLAIGITTGLALGFGRMLQGAHFLSHVLWSGLLCWIVMVMIYMIVMREPEDHVLVASG
jgi:membrane-associated PAP2 superfamily phosphatase